VPPFVTCTIPGFSSPHCAGMRSALTFSPAGRRLRPSVRSEPALPARKQPKAPVPPLVLAVFTLEYYYTRDGEKERSFFYCCAARERGDALPALAAMCAVKKETYCCSKPKAHGGRELGRCSAGQRKSTKGPELPACVRLRRKQIRERHGVSRVCGLPTPPILWMEMGRVDPLGS